MSGRITMLGISRWTSKDGSYRTVQRFFATVLPWTKLLVKFFQTHLLDSESEYILAGDATTVSKCGKQTHGIDRFFSGVIGKVVRGLEFFVVSLVDVWERKSYPLALKQTMRTQAEKEAIKKRKSKRLKKKRSGKKAKRGRPKGSQNKDKKKTASRVMAGIRTLAIKVLAETKCASKRAQLEDFSDDFDSLIEILKKLKFLWESPVFAFL